MLKITSRDNPKLKLARRARDGRARDLIFVEGLRLAEEAVRSNLPVTEVLITEKIRENRRGVQLLEEIERRNFSVNEVSDKIFQAIADTRTSQGIILICPKPETGKRRFEAEFSALKSNLAVVICLFEINNPSNLGAILRTAEAAGAAGVIVSKNSAEVFSPKSLRASMGAGWRLNIWSNADLGEVLDWAKEKDLLTVAADIKAEKSYTEIDWRSSPARLLIFGSEAHGLNARWQEKIEETLRIPMENGVESLNLAVACGIILFEAKRQSSEPKL